MIDLSGLEPLCDVAIGIPSSATYQFTVRFSSEPQQELVDAIYILKSKEMKVYHMTELGSFTYNVFPHNYDSNQVAEKLALFFESKNLKVYRLVSKPESVDKTPCILVESFI